MQITDDYKKGACQCRDCGHVFQKSEIEHRYIERYGQLVPESVCPNPECGSTNYGLIDYLVDEEKLLYYDYSKDNIKLYIGELTNRVIQL